MEPHRPARSANGGHARFPATHMASNLRRAYFTSIWIITFVSSSRTRTYPPNEGECPEMRAPHSAGSSPLTGSVAPPRVQCASEARPAGLSGAAQCLEVEKKLCCYLKKVDLTVLIASLRCLSLKLGQLRVHPCHCLDLCLLLGFNRIFCACVLFFGTLNACFCLFLSNLMYHVR